MNGLASFWVKKPTEKKDSTLRGKWTNELRLYGSDDPSFRYKQTPAIGHGQTRIRAEANALAILFLFIQLFVTFRCLHYSCVF